MESIKNGFGNMTNIQFLTIYNLLLMPYFQKFHVKIIAQKTIFWDRAREYPLNERQLKVLNKLLDKGSENFEAGLSTKKYAKIVSTSIPTAKRDISGLVDYGLIEREVIEEDNKEQEENEVDNMFKNFKV